MMTDGKTKFIGYSRSVMGQSHINRGIVCQDYSKYVIRSDYAISVVSDGHGGTKYFRSEIGSKLAVESAIDVLSDCMADINFKKTIRKNDEETRVLLKRITNAVLSEWNSRIIEYDNKNALSKREISIIHDLKLEDENIIKRYGATLIAGVLFEGCSFGFKIGDGELIRINANGIADIPIETDEDCFLNTTTSLCNSNASQKFHYFCKTDDKSIAIITCTDGLTTSFVSKDSLLRYCMILTDMIDSVKGQNELFQNLKKRSKSNTEDDVSISVILSVKKHTVKRHNPNKRWKHKS